MGSVTFVSQPCSIPASMIFSMFSLSCRLMVAAHGAGPGTRQRGPCKLSPRQVSVLLHEVPDFLMGHLCRLNHHVIKEMLLLSVHYLSRQAFSLPERSLHLHLSGDRIDLVPSAHGPFDP